MEFSDLKQPKSTGSRYEQALCRIESAFGVALTIHDLHGRLRDSYGKTLLPGRHLHPHICCTKGRISEPGWNKLCGRDCFGFAERKAACSPAPFLKVCYKGLRELVVPVHYENHHQMTIFAGVFRSVPEPPSEMPQWFAKLYETLPEADESMLAELAEILKLLGTGLLKEAEREEPSTDTRLVFIRRFIRNRAHEDISLATLAEELFLSASRTGHLVRDLTGKSFSLLLEEERMLRTRHLLLSTDRKLSDIAASVGYPNAYYFNRIFKRRFGISPGRFRKSGQNGVDMESGTD